MAEFESDQLMFLIVWRNSRVSVGEEALAADAAATEPYEIPIVSVGTDPRLRGYGGGCGMERGRGEEFSVGKEVRHGSGCGCEG